MITTTSWVCAEVTWKLLNSRPAGLIVLDEPCARQSDPTVLDMQLRAHTKGGSAVTDQRNLVVGDRNETISYE